MDLVRRNWVVTMLGILLCGGSTMMAQQSGELPDYAPMLPQAKARALPVDPNKGFYVQKLKPDVYMITDGGYEATFVTTGKGVVLFDAPPSMAAHISEAIAQTTSEKLVELVYTHVHLDHIGGAGLVLEQQPGITILAEQGTAEFLRGQKDTRRPVPTRTFKQHESLKLGTLTADLTVGYWHSPEGDLMVSIPDKKFLMAVDAFSANSVPFMDLDLTQNMDAYLHVFDKFLAYDFDVMVPGHHSAPANRQDVQTAKDYAMDVYNTVSRILNADHKALMHAAVAKYGRENTYPTARVLIEDEVNACAAEIQTRWGSRLDNVDVWGPSHCRTALVYAEWDTGPR